MGLLTLIPGDDAIHTPTQTRVHILSYADGNFTAVAMDSENNLINTRRIVGAVTDFVPPPHVTAPKLAADSALSATAQRIADLQAQVATLHKKLQAAEQRADEAASRAAELLAQPAQAITPAATRTEVQIARNIGEKGLARYLNEGWSIIHMQFMLAPIDYEGASVDNSDALHVVLQRTVPADPQPQPEQRATVRTVTGAVVPMSQIIGDDDDDDYEEPDDVPPLPALDPDPLMPPADPLPALNSLVTDTGIDGAAFTRAALAARLSPAQTMELLNNRLKETARAAFNAAPAPMPFMPLGVSK